MPVLSLRHKASWEDCRPSRQLCELFSEWHWENNCFHDHVVSFALAHREELLAAPAGEHSHAVHELHKQFSASLEEFVGHFMAEQGITHEQFAAALHEQQQSGDICTQMTVDVVAEELLCLMEYQTFHKVMLSALALEASYGVTPTKETVGDDPSWEARQLLEDLAMGDSAGAAEAVGQLHAEQMQADIDAGGVE
eukprot:COSAG02_NODE_928_length_15853_cov_9.053574_13_plen_195_part_00